MLDYVPRRSENVTGYFIRLVLQHVIGYLNRPMTVLAASRPQNGPQRAEVIRMAIDRNVPQLVQTFRTT